MGTWNNMGATPTKVTWANPTVVPENQRQSGGWYYNPSSGSVERWWSGGTTGGGTPQVASAMTSAAEPTGDYEAFMKNQEANRITEQNRLKAEGEGILGEYTGAIAGQEKLPTAYTRITGELGVPELTQQLSTVRGEVFKVKDLLTQLEGDINARTSGQLMSESQRRRLLAAEETPLRTQLANLTTGQGEASGQLSTALTQAGNEMTYLTTQQQQELQPVLAKLSMFNDRAARETTSFNTSQQTELSFYLDKLNRERTLSDQQWQQASALAQQEEAYVQEKDKMRLQYEYNLALNKESSPFAGVNSVEEFKQLLGLSGGTTGQISQSGAATTTTQPQWQSQLDKIFGNFNLPTVAGASATLR
jgi:hypothetical protein